MPTVRPSQFLGVSNRYIAYDFDMAFNFKIKNHEAIEKNEGKRLMKSSELTNPFLINFYKGLEKCQR